MPETYTINEYESAIRSCFKDSNDIEDLWYGGKEGKIGENPNCIYIAIREDDNYWKNKCILRDWYFDYDKFKTLPLSYDCYSYGVFVFIIEKKDQKEERRIIYEDTKNTIINEIQNLKKTFHKLQGI